MADDEITVEVSARIEGMGGQIVKHVYQFQVNAKLWNQTEIWERDDMMRRKLCKRLECEYEVVEETNDSNVSTASVKRPSGRNRKILDTLIRNPDHL